MQASRQRSPRLVRGRARGGGCIIRLMLLLLLVLLLGWPPGRARASPGASGAACPDGRGKSVEGRLGTWTVLPSPAFPGGPADVVAHAVDVRQPSRWYVTNGTVVLRSDDGGCGWTLVYELPAGRPLSQPLDREQDRITSITVPDSAVAHDRVYLTVAVVTLHGPLGMAGPDRIADRPVPGDGPAGATLVVRSLDAGRSWQMAGMLAQPLGPPGPLLVSPSVPAVVYAVAGGVLNFSEDGGDNWSARTLPADVQTVMRTDLPPVVIELAVDPLSPEDVWAKTSSGLVHSKDGGIRWTSDPQVGGMHLHGPQVAHDSPGSYTRLVLTRAKDLRSPLDTLLVSDNGGGTWSTYAVPEVVGYHQSMAQGRDGELVLTTVDPLASAAPLTDPLAGPLASPAQPGSGSPARAGVYLVSSDAARMQPIDELGLAPLFDARADRAPRPSFYFRTASTLAVFRPHAPVVQPAPVDVPGPRRRLAPERPIHVPPFDPPPPPARPPAELSPPFVKVALEPGEEAAYDYRLRLPPAPSPLDVFFLLDSSDSMDPAIEGVAQSLARLTRLLTEAGVDARFGLGEFQGIAHDEVRYRRRADIGPPDRAFQQQFATIQTRGGEEPHLTALHQLATGSGVLNPRTGLSVPVGQQAHWRQGSLRVVVMNTDEPFGNDTDGADWSTAVAALREKGVRHIGLEVVPPAVPGAPVAAPAAPTADADVAPVDVGALKSRVRQQLEGLSEATGALAPRGGADCDGDGRADVAEGHALVCTWSPRSDAALADLLVRLLGSLDDRQPVTLQGMDAAAGVQVLPSEGYPDIDMRAGSDLGFTVTFSCTRQQAGSRRLVPLVAAAGGREVASAMAEVVCGAPGMPAPTGPAQPRGLLAPVSVGATTASSAPTAFVVPPPVPPPLTLEPAGDLAQATSSAQATAQAQQGQSAQASQSGRVVQTGHAHAAQVAQRPAGAAAVRPETQVASSAQRDEGEDGRTLWAVRRHRRQPSPYPTLAAGVLLTAACALRLRNRSVCDCDRIRP